jgi:hypothetical protein
LLSSLRHPDQSDYSVLSGFAGEAAHSATADSATTAGQAAKADKALTLDGYAPSALVRTARATQDQPLDLTDSFRTLAKLTIAAPGPGFVLVTSTAKAESDSCDVESPCTAVARLRDVLADGGTVEAGAVSTTTAASVSTGNPYASLAATWVFPVSDAGTHTFVLEAYQDGGEPISVDAAVLTGIFVPFGSAGSSGL